MNERKPIFFWSDLHLEHENSIKFDERPFKDIAHMRRVLINNYNATVPEDGICYFVGDVGLSNNEQTKKTLAEMHGTKILVMGNHDKGLNAMYTLGFDFVTYSASLVIANRLTTITHCPLRGVWREDTTNLKGAQPGDNWHGEHKQMRYSLPDFGQFHLHGHIHSRPGREEKSTKILDRQYDVGVPANAYRPVSISVIESWIGSYGK